MGRLCCILRTRLWFYLLLCVLQVTVAEAATRKYVSMPSDSAVVGSGRGSSVSGDVLSIPGNPLEGEYIPSSYGGGSKGTKLPVQPQYQYVKSRTIKGMVGNLRGGVYGAVLGIGLQYMLDAVDGVIKDGQVQIPQLKTYDPVGPNDYYWTHAAAPGSTKGSTADQSCLLFVQYANTNYSPSNGRTYTMKSNTYVSDIRFTCVITGTTQSGSAVDLTNNVNRNGTTCPSGSTYSGSTGSCTGPSGSYRPATDADYGLMEAAAAAKDSEWLKERLREHCEGSIAPAKCYESLRDSVQLTGPATIQGPTQTTTGTYTKPDGTTGTTGSTSTTNYNIKYGNNYYDYSKSVTTTKTQDGQKVGEETTTESEEPVEEDKPEDDPAPCAANCDGPSYSDQYTPTDQTKEGALGDYMTRVKSAPIIAAGAGFLDVSVSSSCPVWEAHESLDLFGDSMSIDLIFDFHCRPWFVNFQPFAVVIMMTACTFYAFRIAMLD